MSPFPFVADAGCTLEMEELMRSAFGLVALLVAMAIVLLLAARNTEKTVRLANAPIPSLHEDVTPEALDRDSAEALLHELDQWADATALPADEIATARDRAARWAAAARPGSGEYRCAVKVREAADALLAAARGETHRRDDARRFLREARAALASPAAMPGGVVGAVRDQLENLQQSEREKLEDAEHQAP
jgi:hypothetical protein